MLVQSTKHNTHNAPQTATMPPHHVAVGSNGCLPTPCAWPRHRRASRLYSVVLMLVVALAACHCTVSVHGSRGEMSGTRAADIAWCKLTPPFAPSPVLEHASQPSARHLAMTSGPYWYRAGNGSFTGRDCSASLFFNNRMWVFGGGPHGGVPYDDVWYSQDGGTTPTYSKSHRHTLTHLGTSTRCVGCYTQRFGLLLRSTRLGPRGPFTASPSSKALAPCSTSPMHAAAHPPWRHTWCLGAVVVEAAILVVMTPPKCGATKRVPRAMSCY